MKVTKYEHACLDITEGNSRLIVDPGVYSHSFTEFSSVDGLVITHVHGDHCDESKIRAIVAANPDVKIFSTQEVADSLTGVPVTVVKQGKTYQITDFDLEFFGELHEVVDPKTPVAENVGVLINNTVYHPGDSYLVIDKPFRFLAAPKSGPWFRVKDALPLFEKSNCQEVFGTHDGLLNEDGQASVDNWYTKFAERNGKTYRTVNPGESIEI